MTALVIGPNGSGKSAFAERLAADAASGPLVYIATMIPYGDDGARRVKKHIRQRRDYSFTTIEEPYFVSAIELPARATVLLEDVSNLLSNAIFSEKRDAMSVLSDIYALNEKCENLIMVTISGLVSSDGGDDATRAYISELNSVNGALAQWADSVYKMEGSV